MILFEAQAYSSLIHYSSGIVSRSLFINITTIFVFSILQTKVKTKENPK